MSVERTCGKCGTPISTHDPEQLCKHCLMACGLEPDLENLGLESSYSTAAAGMSFGEYELLSEIGHGGQGIVYRARQKELNRLVALKCIPLGQFTSAEQLKRFRIEAEAAGRLDHPGIVPVYEVGQQDGFCFYSMKLMEGGRLDHALGRRPMQPRQAAEMVASVGRAVHFAHQRGILHRDLKPANILLDNSGRPHLADFGLARLIEQDSTLTRTLAILGTPSYMAPEQAQGGGNLTVLPSGNEDVERQSRGGDAQSESFSNSRTRGTTVEITTAVDVYGLGAILYHLLTAAPPFAGGTTFETVRLLLDTDPRPPSSLRPSVDRDLETICLKCLEKQPQRRYGSAEAVAEELERWLRSEPILARPVSRVERFWRYCRRKPALATLGALLGLSLTVLGIGAPLTAFRIYGERTLKEAHAYAADMNLAQGAWNAGNWLRAQALLRSYIPKPGQHDMRGFEWRYLWRLCHDESRVTNSPSGGQAAQSRDGKMTATVSDSFLKVFDSETGRELKRLSPPAPGDGFGAFAFSPTDTNLVATTFDHNLHLWNLQRGQTLASMTLSNWGQAIAFSPDGKHLAVAGGNNRSLELWSLETRSQEWQLQGAKDSITSFINLYGFTPDGQSLITSSQLALVIWDVASRTASRLPREHRAVITAADISQDGATLVSGAMDSQIVFWDLTTKRAKATMLHPGAYVTALKLSADGRLLLTGASDSTIRLWNVATGQQISLYRGHQAGVTAVFFSADARSILSSSWDGTMKIWDRVMTTPSSILHTNENWSSITAFSADGKKLVAADLFNGVLSVWDASTRRHLTNLTRAVVEEYAGAGAAFSPDGKWLVMTASDGQIRLWEGPQFVERSVLTNSFGPNSISISADNRILAVAGTAGMGDGGITNRLAFWDLPTGRLLDWLGPAVPNAACVAFAHRPPLVAVGYMDGAVHIWDYARQSLVASFSDQHSRVWMNAFSPDDAWLASGGFDGAVVLYDLRRRIAVRSSADTSSWVVGLAFSPDGRRLASAEGDGAIRLWDVRTMRCTLELRGHGGPVSKVAFSPDGNLLASCGADGTLRLWEACSAAAMPSSAPPPF